MDIENLFFGLSMIGILITCVLYVIFGQITVRKLRNNPVTKNALGSEFASGWDILNVAKALSIPRSWSKKLENSRFSFLYANSDLIFKNTTKLDRFLGFIFFWFWVLSGSTMILLVVMNNIDSF